METRRRASQPVGRRVAAVQRALTVLDELAAAQVDLGTNELARRTGINASSVSRLLATLGEAGVVEQMPETGRYRLGLRLLELGNAVLERLDIRTIARGRLEALVDSTGETATLSAPGQAESITIDVAQSTSTVQSVPRLGRPGMGHATATGKIVLAFGLTPLPAGRLERYTERTIVDRAVLGRHLAEIRAQGWAEAVGERELDLNAIAAPILGQRGELVSVLGVQGPASRFDRAAMRTALGPLLAGASAISKGLGARPGAPA
ncbi:MAG: IclR family transcriptional regulator [Gaiellaceae bacterium]